jgi:hypothetical protein
MKLGNGWNRSFLSVVSPIVSIANWINWWQNLARLASRRRHSFLLRKKLASSNIIKKWWDHRRAKEGQIRTKPSIVVKRVLWSAFEGCRRDAYNNMLWQGNKDYLFMHSGHTRVRGGRRGCLSIFRRRQRKGSLPSPSWRPAWALELCRNQQPF